jgi:glycosyltransferase involved in cell wall biosynthesis
VCGGVAVVLQHANRLMNRGKEVLILSLSQDIDADWFFGNNVPINIFDEAVSIIQSYDIVIATHFSTVEIVKNTKANRKIYFVQSDERRFYNDFLRINKCENTYQDYELEYMTEALWIQRWLKEEFNHEAYYEPNGLDRKLFYETKPLVNKNNIPRILIEGPINHSFKGMKDAYDSVKNLDCELWIVSNYGVPDNDWKYDRFFEKVPMNKMKEIYSACDIFLKMSKVEGFFGPPLEAMACGCAVVVGKCTGYDEYIINEKNALVVEQGDVSEARFAIQRLIDDKSLKDDLIKNGKKTVKKWSWSRSIDFLERVIAHDVKKQYYSKKYPEQYQYVRVMKSVYEQSAKYHYLQNTQKDQQITKLNCENQQKEQIINQKTQELQQKDQIIDQKQHEIKQMQSSKSFRLGNLFFRSLERPYKMLTFPINFVRILIGK